MAMALPFDYTVTRTKRKSIAVYVRDGQADVRAPTRAPNYFIHQFLEEKSSWIQQQIRKQQRIESQRYTLHDGARLTFLGDPLLISYCDTPSHLQGHTLSLKQGRDDAATLKNFDKWLKQQGDDLLRPLTVEIARELGVANTLSKVCYRKTKSKWGHCTSKGVIQFNPLILLAPYNVVAYLVCHEVCHLKHMNHSASFWALVATVCPDYLDARRWLHQHGDLLMGLHKA